MNRNVASPLYASLRMSSTPLESLRTFAQRVVALCRPEDDRSEDGRPVSPRDAQRTVPQRMVAQCRPEEDGRPTSPNVAQRCPQDGHPDDGRREIARAWSSRLFAQDRPGSPRTVVHNISAQGGRPRSPEGLVFQDVPRKWPGERSLGAIAGVCCWARRQDSRPDGSRQDGQSESHHGPSRLLARMVAGESLPRMVAGMVPRDNRPMSPKGVALNGR